MLPLGDLKNTKLSLLFFPRHCRSEVETSPPPPKGYQWYGRLPISHAQFWQLAGLFFPLFSAKPSTLGRRFREVTRPGTIFLISAISDHGAEKSISQVVPLRCKNTAMAFHNRGFTLSNNSNVIGMQLATLAKCQNHYHADAGKNDLCNNPWK